MEKIEELENFFDLDLKIKNLIIRAKPNLYNSNPVDEEETLLKVLNVIRRSIREMSKIAFNNSLINLENKIDFIEKEIQNCNYDMNKIMNVYEKYFYKMNIKLEKSLEENIFGNLLNTDIKKPLENCDSINDILHYLHFYMTNTNKMLNFVEKRESRKNDSNGQISIYGKEDTIAKKIYNDFPSDIFSDSIDIVSFNNHIMMMVRDVGHSLSINITYENNSARVEYFIPKVCNVEKVNELIGVKKLDPSVDKFFSSTTGEFIVSKDLLSKSIIEFIKNVPTDIDIKPISNHKI